VAQPVINATSTSLYTDNIKKKTLAHATVAGKDATAHFFGASAKVPTSVLNAEVRVLMAWRRALPAGELGSLQNQKVEVAVDQAASLLLAAIIMLPDNSNGGVGRVGHDGCN
jgi:uncharacterized iron-regulated membrane protein